MLIIYEADISRRDFTKITITNMALYPVRTVEKTKKRVSAVKDIDNLEE